MARVLGLFPSALIAAAQNSGAGVFYRTLRDLGIAPRQSEAYALYRMAKGITESRDNDIFSDLGSNPAEGALPEWPTRNATGVRQNISLVYRDRTTGAISRTFYSVVSDEGINREDAIAQAIQSYSDNAEAYNQDLIGAVHVSAYQLTPMGY
jgi:hypothetical protein